MQVTHEILNSPGPSEHMGWLGAILTYFRNVASLYFDFGRSKIVLNFVINNTYFGTLLSAQNL